MTVNNNRPKYHPDDFIGQFEHIHQINFMLPILTLTQFSSVFHF